MHNRLTKFSLLDEVSLKWEFDYEDEGGAGTLPPGTKGVIVDIYLS
ncbi:hypothetical protein NUH30_16010 [Leptospira sp. 85282-16]|nr:hypothetical protein [Leptospira sp. 85282-16]MCT8335186.1 hypothetical protein [Leptospira sp. 85282-16]